MSDKVRTAFELDGVTLPLSAIHPIRQVKPLDHAWGKYRAVLSSLKEVGLIEPLIVFPQRGARGAYVATKPFSLSFTVQGERSRNCLLPFPQNSNS